MEKLETAYKFALQFAKSHYENFPVVSLTLPVEIRKHIAVIYQFARKADDLADEGIVSEELRVKNLELYESYLTGCLNGEYATDFWYAMHSTIQKFNLSHNHFYNLLSAFKQDVIKKRYKNFEELLDYCRRSANPVGRIILEIFDCRTQQTINASDAVCTALQLTNFYQDVAIDFANNRIYIPQDEMEKFGITEKIFEKKQNNSNFKQLMSYQVERTKELFNAGRKIFVKLPGALRPQIKMTLLGGEQILKKIEEIDFNVLNYRPVLKKADYFKIIMKALFTYAR